MTDREAHLNSQKCSGNLHLYHVLLATLLSWLATAQEAGDILQVRLNGGSAPWEGIVEVLYKGWGTVCDDYWDRDDGYVTCRQLGYESVISVTTGRWQPFDIPDLFIVMDNVECNGSEANLGLCAAVAVDDKDHNCAPTEAAGVVCQPKGAPNIRLSGGAYPNQGRVEIFLNGEWGTICDTSWGIDSASMVCRQLGYLTAVEAVVGSAFGNGQGNILLEDEFCQGNSDVYFCGNDDTGINGSYECRGAAEENIAGVVCFSYAYPNNAVIQEPTSPPKTILDGLRNIAREIAGITVILGILLTCLCVFYRRACKDNVERSQGNYSYTAVPSAHLQHSAAANAELSGAPSSTIPSSATYPPPAAYAPSKVPPSASYPPSTDQPGTSRSVLDRGPPQYNSVVAEANRHVLRVTASARPQVMFKPDTHSVSIKTFPTTAQ